MCDSLILIRRISMAEERKLYICNGKVPDCGRDVCFYLYGSSGGYCRHTDDIKYSKTLEETGNPPSNFEELEPNDDDTKLLFEKPTSTFIKIDIEDIPMFIDLWQKDRDYYQQGLDTLRYCEAATDEEDFVNRKMDKDLSALSHEDIAIRIKNTDKILNSYDDIVNQLLVNA